MRNKAVPVRPPPVPAMNSPQQKQKMRVLLFVLFLTFVALSPSLFNDISTWDDEVHLLKNKQVLSLSPDNVVKIFRQDVCKTYLPLTILSFAVEHQFFGFNPVVYHLNNVLLHLAVVALIYVFALRLHLSVWAAGIAALIFGIHPMHVESVAWATERKDVLYALFYMLALIEYLKFQDSPRPKHYVLALWWGLLSMLSKAMAFSLPFVLLVLDWYRGRKNIWQALAEKVPFLFYIFPLAWITFSLNSRAVGQDIVSGLSIWAWTGVFYIWKFFLPVILLPLYPLPKPISFANLHYAGALLLLVLLLVGLYRFRRERLLLFAFVYYFASIFFLLRYDNAIEVNIVADRFMYLPSLGLCLALGVYLEKLFHKAAAISAQLKTGLLFIGIALLLFLSGKTFLQTQVWRNDFTMWSYVLKHSPDSDSAHFGLGQFYFEQGKRGDALYHYLTTLRLNPNHAKANNNVGDMLYAEGRFDEAAKHFELAVQLNPEYAEAHNNYGVMLMEQGKSAAARQHIERAIKLEPESMIYYVSLGDLDYRDNRFAAAKKQYEWVLAREPRNAKALNRLGAIALQEGQVDAAVKYFQQALAVDPTYESAKHNLRVALTKQYQDRR